MANVPANVPTKTLSWLWAVVEGVYRDPRRTYSDLAHTLARYPSLAPRTDVYTFENGTNALLVRLVGTVPVTFRGTVYRFPIALWIPHAYPYEAPIVYVTPTDEMVVRQGQHVAGDGRIYHHYLAHWPEAWDVSATAGQGDRDRRVWPPLTEQQRSHVADLLTILSGIFANEPPQQPGAPPRPPPKQPSAQEEQRPNPAQARPGRYEAPLPLPQQPQSAARLPSMYSEHAQSNATVQYATPPPQTMPLQQNSAAIPPLQSQNAALQSTMPRLQAELASLSALQDTLKSNISLLQESLSHADQTISSARQRAAAGDIPKVDDMLVPPHVVGKQLYDTVTEERGVETAIFALHDAFIRGRVSSDVWSRKTRELARDGFKKRYLSRKIGVGMAVHWSDPLAWMLVCLFMPVSALHFSVSHGGFYHTTSVASSPCMLSTFYSARSRAGSELIEEYLCNLRPARCTASHFLESGCQYKISLIPVADIIDMVTALKAKTSAANDCQHDSAA
ncbi:hypothetical protein DV736_g4378, partial [Chaetothyriales sp. CBS 134916]